MQWSIRNSEGNGLIFSFVKLENWSGVVHSATAAHSSRYSFYEKRAFLAGNGCKNIRTVVFQEKWLALFDTKKAREENEDLALVQ